MQVTKSGAGTITFQANVFGCYGYGRRRVNAVFVPTMISISFKEQNNFYNQLMGLKWSK